MQVQPKETITPSASLNCLLVDRMGIRHHAGCRRAPITTAALQLVLTVPPASSPKLAAGKGNGTALANHDG